MHLATLYRPLSLLRPHAHVRPRRRRRELPGAVPRTMPTCSACRRNICWSARTSTRRWASCGARTSRARSWQPTTARGPRIDAIRQFTFGGTLDYIEHGRRDLETRGIGDKFVTEFENSDRVTVDLLRSYEFLVEPFQIASNVAIPIGGTVSRTCSCRTSWASSGRVSRHRVRAARDVLRRRHRRVRVPPGAHRPDAEDVD